jgi:hypothetical protein
MKLNITIGDKSAGTVDLKPGGFEVVSSHPRAGELKALLDAFYADGIELKIGTEKPVCVSSRDRRFFLELGAELMHKGFQIGP